MNVQKRIVDIDVYMPVVCELLARGKEVSIVVTGNSMAPFLIHGRDEILVAPADGKWKKGDMVFFRRKNGQYVMHRICGVHQDGSFSIIGDGQFQVEHPVFSSQMFGKITSVKRKGTWIGPGNFCWEFFARIWVKMIPLRPAAWKLYRIVTFWKKRK